MSADINDEVAGLVFTELTGSHSALMADSKANTVSINHIGRATGIKKFDEVGPIEAAAVEKVLKS